MSLEKGDVFEELFLSQNFLLENSFPPALFGKLRFQLNNSLLKNFSLAGEIMEAKE